MIELLKPLTRSTAALAIISLFGCSEPPMAGQEGSETAYDPYEENRVSVECQECVGANCPNELVECDLDEKCLEVSDCVQNWESFELQQCRDIARGNEAWMDIMVCARDNCAEACEDVEVLFPSIN